ncbi:YncE family protein [Variovorax sp. OV329]|uniref:YncE family protein n=1 Tax=Variovorax sp. OV329 TaxID=1882825 RepID=UPI0008E4CEFC|nr:YncE family protein [Variovorax sp. OV329]SFN07986.1 DNA-binding beta-propeller fold protein YncE [Variovorax sp. OV329]
MSASLQPHAPGARPGFAWAGAWAFLRIPLLLVLLFLLRRPLLDLVEEYLGIERVTYFAIALLSTPVARVGVLALAVLMLWAVSRWSASRFSAWRAYALTVAFGALITGALFALTGTSLWKASLPLACLALNLLPVSPAQQARKAWSRLMLFGVGLAEVFFFRRYVAWVAASRRRIDPAHAPPASVGGRFADLPGLVITGLVMAVFVGGPGIISVERELRMPSKVGILMREDINGLALDPDGRHLYVTGHGLEHLQRIDTQAPGQPPLVSTVSTGGAQGVAFDPKAGELYVFNTRTRALQYFDAATLALRREVPLRDLSPGDPWIAADPVSGTLVVASEADDRSGSPFIVLDRQSGQILDRRDVDAGNLYLHPQGGKLYLSFFRNSSRLMLYDLQRKEFSATVQTDERVDRMAFDPTHSELLLASPLRSRVLRFDAQTLAKRGEIPSVFGVRVIAIDQARGWMLTASLVTGQLEIQDLASNRVIKRIYLGPWLRTIELDTASGTAYVSANGALYKVPYGAGD